MLLLLAQLALAAPQASTAPAISPLDAFAPIARPLALSVPAPSTAPARPPDAAIEAEVDLFVDAIEPAREKALAALERNRGGRLLGQDWQDTVHGQRVCLESAFEPAPREEQAGRMSRLWSELERLGRLGNTALATMPEEVDPAAASAYLAALRAEAARLGPALAANPVVGALVSAEVERAGRLAPGPGQRLPMRLKLCLYPSGLYPAEEPESPPE